MKAFASLCLALLVLTSAAWGIDPPIAPVLKQPLKVQVVNLPEVQPVEVANPTACGQGRFQLVGFTSATYTGDLGGPFGATQKCQIEFPASRMCERREVFETVTLPQGLTGNAWIRLEPVFEVFSASCDQYRRASYIHRTIDVNGTVTSETQRVFSDGILVSENGAVVNWGAACDAERPIACCALVP